jgi:hypothetical protein
MERLAKSREIAQNKLILLYILSKAKAPVSVARLSEYVSQQRLMEYITFRQHFNELAVAGYIEQDIEAGMSSGGAYAITGMGMGMLAELGGLLPTPWARRIDRTASPLLGAAKKERAVVAIDTVDINGRSVAELGIQDGDRSIIRISMLAGSRQDARAICKRWKENTADLYIRIVEALTGNDDDGSGSDGVSDGGSDADGEAADGESADGEADDGASTSTRSIGCSEGSIGGGASVGKPHRAELPRAPRKYASRRQAVESGQHALK